MSKDLENRKTDGNCEPEEVVRGVPFYKTPEQKAKYIELSRAEETLYNFKKLNANIETFIGNNTIHLKKDKELDDCLTLKINYDRFTILELLGQVLRANKQNEVELLDHVLKLRKEFIVLTEKDDE